MNRRNKILLSSTIFLLVLIFFVIMSVARTESYESISTRTKAICNEDNYCVDVLITCNGSKVVDIKPVDGGVYFTEDWEDPRPIEVIEKWC